LYSYAGGDPINSVDVTGAGVQDYGKMTDQAAQEMQAYGTNDQLGADIWKWNNQPAIDRLNSVQDIPVLGAVAQLVLSGWAANNGADQVASDALGNAGVNALESAPLLAFPEGGAAEAAEEGAVGTEALGETSELVEAGEVSEGEAAEVTGEGETAGKSLAEGGEQGEAVMEEAGADAAAASGEATEASKAAMGEGAAAEGTAAEAGETAAAEEAGAQATGAASTEGGAAQAVTESVSRPATSPNYSVVMEAKLNPGTYTASDANHFRQANRRLYQILQSNPDLAAKLETQYPGITAHVTPGPRGGVADTSPPGLTWHHDPNTPGNLQLVPRDQHQAPGPIQISLHPNQQGGREIWGGGR